LVIDVAWSGPRSFTLELFHAAGPKPRLNIGDADKSRSLPRNAAPPSAHPEALPRPSPDAPPPPVPLPR